MTSISVPTASSRFPQRILVPAIILAAVAAVVYQLQYRSAEIWVAGQLARLFTSGGVAIDAANQTYYFNIDTPQTVGLTMTPECTSAFLILPLFLAATALCLLRSSLTGKVLVALIVSVTVVIAVNQLRLLSMIWLMDIFGNQTGYYWGHTLLGSIVSIIGGAGALVLFVILALRKGSQDTDAH
jgi:exosortase/archaeosortase family protein